MASKPSGRGHRGKEDIPPLNITPIMNLIIILIPALLLSAAFVQIAVINVSAPQIGSGVAEEKPEDEEKKLNLTVAVTDKGFTVAGTGAVLGGEGAEEAGPTIPKKADGEYDYEALANKLAEIKDAFPDETKMVLNAEPDIKYSKIIATMDATRELEGRMLFPDVVLSAGIQ
ncbi:MAG: biopolymer transporter ExbD [Deltaproteobacteria bacterium]|nr:biopolymer transporter ExbD [Deltaproteobacteria bacterium]